MTLKLNGSSSGYVAIDAPAAAGSNTLVLPADNGSNGEYLQTNGSGVLDWAVAGGGKVLQYVYNSSTTNVTSTGSEHVIVDASITPASTSNKIFIIGNATIGSNSNSNSYGGGRIRRGDVSGTILSEWSFGHAMSNDSEDHVSPWTYIWNYTSSSNNRNTQNNYFGGFRLGAAF